MRRTLPFSAFLLLACSGGDKAPATDSAAAAPPAATLKLADLAGKWTQVVSPEGSDSALVTSELNASAVGSSWTITLPGRAAMPIQITTSGDSIMTSTGPYESVLMKGVQVTTNGVARLVDGKMVGITVAHYAGVKTADSVRRMRSVATKNP